MRTDGLGVISKTSLSLFHWQVKRITVNMVSAARKYLIVVGALVFGETHAFAFQTPSGNSIGKRRRSWSLGVKPKGSQDEMYVKRRRDPLAASSIADPWTDKETEPRTLRLDLANNQRNLVEMTLLPVASTSLLITGNTVGAGMLILPELAARPGMAISMTIFTVAFLINLISGLLIAEVAISQHDTSGNEVPSSFKEFAEANLPKFGEKDTANMSAVFISGVSVLVNALVLAFNTAKIGDFGSASLQGILPADLISMSWVMGCIAVVGTQSFSSLSTITSILVFGLFASFAGLLFPSLANMSSGPMDLLFAPGTSSDILGSASELAPIVLMSLVYQNIVPTVTKMLDYDRTKSMVAITLGSFIPFCMYVAWTFGVLGGGLEMDGGPMVGPLLTLFTLTTIAGSSIGCVMSLAEEFDTFVKQQPPIEESLQVANNNGDNKFSFASVLLSVACAGIALPVFADNLNGALEVAGSLGSPLLYGVLPVLMAYTQRKRRGSADSLPQPPPPALPQEFFLPDASIGLLGVASTGFVGNELLQSAQEIMAFVMA